MKNILGGIILMALLTACGGKKDAKTQLEELKKQKSELESKISELEKSLGPESKDSVKTLLVGAEILKAETFQTYIDVQGRVDADENVSISSEIPGTITKINVKAGDEVSKGQVLAETDARAIQQSIADLQINAELVNQIYEKQKALWDQKIGTEVQFLQAKTQKESMEKKMATLQEQLRMTKIISPINGTVDAVDLKVGQLVAPGMPAMRVINFNNLKVKADLAESYASRVKKGDQAIIFFPDMKDSVMAKISYAARAINLMNRTFMVEILLDNKKEYHPNMVTKLKINDYTSAKPVIVIPVKMIQKQSGNQQFVWVAENGKAKRQLIKTGKEYNGKAEVVEGLKENDVLITEGFEGLNDGQALTIKTN